MFERFTAEARATVVAARDLAGKDAVRDEHLLLALLTLGTTGARLLRQLGLDLTAGAVAERFASVRRRGGVTDADAAALRSLGIDVDEVVATVQQSLGPDALARELPISRRGRLRRPAGGPFTDGAKRVLEMSLRQALELNHRHIGQEHILLGLLVRPGLVSETLAAEGVTYGAARELVEATSADRSRRRPA